jgi:hypothetical protein
MVVVGPILHSKLKLTSGTIFDKIWANSHFIQNGWADHSELADYHFFFLDQIWANLTHPWN